MIQIQDTLVSLDLIERFFCCDLSQCHGQCCIDGDAGAPLDMDEVERIEEVLPQIYGEMDAAAQKVVENQGVCYVDSDGDLVTSIVDGKDCVFTTYTDDGICLCLLEKAYREGRIPQCKPSSCHLYPVRLAPCGLMTAVNLHRWSVCRTAELNGLKRGIRAYQFLREPLIRQFGEDWYAELELTADEWVWQHAK